MKARRSNNYEVEVKRSDIVRILSADSIDEMRKAVMNLVIEKEPNLCSIEYGDGPVDAMLLQLCKIDHPAANTYSLTVLGVIEEYEADDDGEFLYGSDFSWDGWIDQEWIDEYRKEFL